MRHPRHNCCDDARWAPIPDFPDYEISTCGKVRKGDKYPSISVTPRGYAVVNVGGKTKNVHTLVLAAFVGPRPRGQCACHYDGEQTNNHLSNLRWDSYRNNFKDRDRHGTTYRGERVWASILNEPDIARITKLSRAGNSHTDIASYFGVTASTITRIVNGQSWKHVERPQ